MCNRFPTPVPTVMHTSAAALRFRGETIIYCRDERSAGVFASVRRGFTSHRSRVWQVNGGRRMSLDDLMSSLTFTRRSLSSFSVSTRVCFYPETCNHLPVLSKFQNSSLYYFSLPKNKHTLVYKYVYYLRYNSTATITALASIRSRFQNLQACGDSN